MRHDLKGLHDEMESEVIGDCLAALSNGALSNRNPEGLLGLLAVIRLYKSEHLGITIEKVPTHESCRESHECSGHC
jgi:hypothetical protein